MGMIPEEMIGVHYTKALPPDFAGKLQPYLERALEGKTCSFYVPIPWNVAGAAAINSVFPLFDSEDNVGGITIISHDVDGQTRDMLRRIGYEPHPTHFSQAGLDWEFEQ